MTEGPFAYEYWRAALNGTPINPTFEFPLFTDAHITAEVVSGLGAYQLLNTVSIPLDSKMLFRR